MSPATASIHPVTAACADIRAALLELNGDNPPASLRETLRAAALKVAALPRRHAESPLASDVLQMVRAVTASGEHDRPVTPEDLALAQASVETGWPGTVAAMLLVPAWQWPDAPRVESVPPWLWPDYVAYLFATPQGFCACGQAKAYAAHYLRRLEELARLAAANRGSTQVRAALAAYVQSANCIPLYFAEGSLRRHYELRARLLKAAFNVPAQEEMFPQPRDGRRLRVGFVSRHFSPQTETYSTLPTFEQLDPERFEVVLFVHHSGGTPVENFARGRVAGFHVLPADFNAQLNVLRGAQLDVAVFATNVTAVIHEVTRLALCRVAPLQIATNSSCTTTGMPEMDVYISGTLTESAEAPEQFTERLALLPGPTHAFNYEADKQPATTALTRAALGLPEDATVFVSAANYFKVIPEMQEAWARLLAAVPGSRLLLHPFNPNWSSDYPIKRFRSGFDRVLAAHGVATDRLTVSTMRFPSRTDVKELLRVGDIYLDTFPFGGVNSLVDPLENGTPVVAWEGTTFRSRMGAALLRNLGHAELIARDETGYLEICTRLAADAAGRMALGARIAEAMEQGPLFLDPLAASDAFGALLETAFDDLERLGREAFRAERTPLVAPGAVDVGDTLQAGAMSLAMGMGVNAAEQAQAVLRGAPNHPAARALLGRSLLAGGNAARATDYLLAAVLHTSADAEVWFDLAVALRACRRLPQALEALEAALRLDARRLDGWIMFAELARNLGAQDIAREALSVAQELDGEDARVVALAQQLG